MLPSSLESVRSLAGYNFEELAEIVLPNYGSFDTTLNAAEQELKSNPSDKTRARVILVAATVLLFRFDRATTGNGFPICPMKQLYVGLNKILLSNLLSDPFSFVEEIILTNLNFQLYSGSIQLLTRFCSRIQLWK